MPKSGEPRSAPATNPAHTQTMKTTPTKEQLTAGFNIVVAVTEAIREAKEIPAGTLYAVLCGKVDMQAFDKIVRIIVGSGLVERRGDLLRWIGPEVR